MVIGTGAESHTRNSRHLLKCSQKDKTIAAQARLQRVTQAVTLVSHPSLEATTSTITTIPPKAVFLAIEMHVTDMNKEP
jgi:hypothetical protein